MFGHTMASATVAVAVAGCSVFVAVSSDGRAHRGPLTANARAAPTAPVLRTSRPSGTDWDTIKHAARLRRMALEPRRTAAYRSFAAYMALSGLMELHPLRRGRCSAAVSFLYDNLLDLRQALPGEDWMPLRRYVAREPAVTSCTPPPARFHLVVPLES